MPAIDSLHIFDWIFLGILTIGMPVQGAWEIRRMKRRVGTGDPGARIWGYKLILVMEWTLALGVLSGWNWLGRPAEDLGITLPHGPWAGVVLGLAVLLAALIIGQLVMLLRDPEELGKMRGELGDIEALLPHHPIELQWFYLVSITAGICEELLYRGFLIAILAVVLPGGLWVGALASSVIFGMAHIYQGRDGVWKTAAVGAVFAAFYLLSGSLWVPMVLHALLDAVNGKMAFEAFALAPRRIWDEPGD